MDLTTTYLGMKLKNPLVPSASPLSEDVDNIKRMEDKGASAVVLYSLFEEQLRMDSLQIHSAMTEGTESYAEALTYFPESHSLEIGTGSYIQHIQDCKKAVEIPIIASINGSSLSGWTQYAKEISEAGADALELNLYHIPTDPDMTGAQVEDQYVEVVRQVRAAVNIPLGVKISPFFSNLSNMAKRFEEAGANSLILFNRFYQPDVDLENLDIAPHILFSTPQALRLPLTWIGILYKRTSMDLAATSGIQTGRDVIKMLMVGANITQLCSTLFRHGINHIENLERELQQWMEEHEYESVEQMQGSMSQVNSPNPSAFERAQYIRAVTSHPLVRP